MQVSDDGSPPLTAARSYIIALTDVNEAPEFADQVFAVYENISRGALVGTALSDLTFDPDANDALTYVIKDYGTDRYLGIFAIAPSLVRVP